MPNVISVGLGGGSLVTRNRVCYYIVMIYIPCPLIMYITLQNDVLVGPSSVGSQLTTKALSFGGDTCTATDVAIAADICEGN